MNTTRDTNNFISALEFRYTIDDSNFFFYTDLAADSISQDSELMCLIVVATFIYSLRCGYQFTVLCFLAAYLIRQVHGAIIIVNCMHKLHASDHYSCHV